MSERDSLRGMDSLTPDPNDWRFRCSEEGQPDDKEKVPGDQMSNVFSPLEESLSTLEF